VASPEPSEIRILFAGRVKIIVANHMKPGKRSSSSVKPTSTNNRGAAGRVENGKPRSDCAATSCAARSLTANTVASTPARLAAQKQENRLKGVLPRWQTTVIVASTPQADRTRQREGCRRRKSPRRLCCTALSGCGTVNRPLDVSEHRPALPTVEPIDHGNASARVDRLYGASGTSRIEYN